MIARVAVFLCLFNSALLILASCPENGVLGYGNNGRLACYLFERFPAKFLIAEQNCRKSGGHLASIGSVFINDYVAQMGNEVFDVINVTSFWVGAQNLQDPNVWRWFDGALFNFDNWLNGKPKESCCLGLFLNGSWTGLNCFEDKPYVCVVEPSNLPTTPPSLKTTLIDDFDDTTPEDIIWTPEQPTSEQTTERITTSQPTTQRITTEILTTTTTKKPPKSCKTGWTYLEKTSKCYKVISTITNPLGCFQQNAVESSIHSDEENDLLADLANQKSLFAYDNVKVRLSLIKGLDKKFHWVDHTPANYFKWANNPGSWDCVQFNTCRNNRCWSSPEKNVWTTVSCLLNFADYLICSKDP
ncbi:hypothetical protein M3Y97_00607500 [Aphelenchoides bicaudatus]|nr:hypothetical protein M3Y97_00607500 [Aphelenchoides bicaudatus]